MWFSIPIKNRKSSNHADLRPGIKIGVTGFEPAASWSQTRRSSQTEPHPETQMLFYTNAITESIRIAPSDSFEAGRHLPLLSNVTYFKRRFLPVLDGADYV